MAQGAHKGPAHKGPGGPKRARPARAVPERAQGGPTRAKWGPQGPGLQELRGVHKGPVCARSARVILVYIYIYIEISLFWLETCWQHWRFKLVAPLMAPETHALCRYD